MMRFFCILLLCVLALTSCQEMLPHGDADSFFDSSSSNASLRDGFDKWKNKAEYFVRMERTPCVSRCKSYVIEIYPDGKVYYKGIKNVKNLGEFYTEISNDELSVLKSKIKSIHYFDLQERYPLEPVSNANLPVTYTEVKLDSQVHKIINQNEMTPVVLSEFENMIDNLIEGKPLEMKK